MGLSSSAPAERGRLCWLDQLDQLDLEDEIWKLPDFILKTCYDVQTNGFVKPWFLHVHYFLYMFAWKTTVLMLEDLYLPSPGGDTDTTDVPTCEIRVGTDAQLKLKVNEPKPSQRIVGNHSPEVSDSTLEL